MEAPNDEWAAKFSHNLLSQIERRCDVLILALRNRIYGWRVVDETKLSAWFVADTSAVLAPYAQNRVDVAAAGESALEMLVFAWLSDLTRDDDNLPSDSRIVEVAREFSDAVIHTPEFA